jgi:hypothetical protein
MSEAVAPVVLRTAQELLQTVLYPLIDKANMVAKEIISHGRVEAEKFVRDSGLTGPDAQLVYGGSMNKTFKRATETMKDTISEFVKQLNPWVQNFLHLSERGIGVMEKWTPEEIRKNLIDPFFGRLDILEEKVYFHANAFLTRAGTFYDERLEKTDCMLRGNADRLYGMIVDRWATHLFPNFFDECRRSLDIAFTPGPMLNLDQIYELQRCYLMKQVQPEKNICNVLNALNSLTALAADFKCVMKEANVEKYTNHWVFFREQYLFWSSATRACDGYRY